MNVLIISGNSSYHLLFRGLGHKIVEDVNSADLVVFTGGEDVTPAYYDAKAHPLTGNNPIRDAHEALIFDAAKQKGVPMVGICRGGQFLNVMNGGSMYQHVEKHVGSHLITDVLTGETVWVSSTHHQMMKPSPEGILVASSTLAGRREWYDGQIFVRDVSDEDIEVVFYPDTRSLCFQPHPEFQGDEFKAMREYFAKCLERFVFTEEVAA